MHVLLKDLHTKRQKRSVLKEHMKTNSDSNACGEESVVWTETTCIVYVCCHMCHWLHFSMTPVCKCISM